MATSLARRILPRQLQEVNSSDMGTFSAEFINDNMFKWRISILGPPDTILEGGMFVAEMEFPEEYPNLPPKLTFRTKMWHPSIYDNGGVCISILHPPKVDEYGYEDVEERWRPIHTAESILLSVMSLLLEETPDTSSPANVDAAIQARNDTKTYKRTVRRYVRDSAETYDALTTD